MALQFSDCFRVNTCISKWCAVGTQRKLRSFLVALLFLSSFSLHAQQQTVTGTVEDKDNKPLANASVQVSGTKRGTVTDEQGHFTIAASKGNVLVVSSVG
ncbi:MAG: carboxypeptidase-like regulatory domain-containing protein, partial [Bacteroidota bacterium]|nr:carboxypeptidase-like regulatory domain-containing protein [Bacteroidota bacterium]